MPDVLDSFVIELGLDPKKLNQGQTQALADLRKFQEDALRHAKGIEETSRRSGEAIGLLKKQAVEAFAVLAGGKGIVEFVQHLTTADSAVGRVSRSTGISVNTISKWQGAARLLGGDAASMAQSFIKMNDAMEGLKVGVGDADLMANLAGIGKMGGHFIDITKGKDEVYLQIAENLRAISEKEGAGMAGMLGRRLNLDPALLDMLLKGREYTKQILDQINAMGPATEASADAAGELERRWHSIFLRTEGTGRQVGLIPDILAAADFLSMTPGEAWDYLNRTDRATNGISSSPRSLTPGFDASPGSQAYRDAIAAIESRGSGGYAAIGPVTASGDRAYGRYQIMGNNIGPWSQAALGRQLSTEEFMKNPALQDQIFDSKFGEYVKKYGNPQDAASAWLTGRPLAGGGAGARDLYGTSGAEYARRFTANLHSGSTTTTTVAINGPITIQAGPNADGADIAQKFRDSILKRAALANQSPVGSQ